jgi:hypothetical protein
VSALLQALLLCPVKGLYVPVCSVPLCCRYHDHALHITAENAYRGLFGFLIMSDIVKDGGCGAPYNLEVGDKGDIPMLSMSVWRLVATKRRLNPSSRGCAWSCCLDYGRPSPANRCARIGAGTAGSDTALILCANFFAFSLPATCPFPAPTW